MRDQFSFTSTSGKILAFGIVGLMASTALAATSAKTGWSVNRVSSAAAGSYCTMAQKYADDTVMTIAKNPNGQFSVAFDMPSKIFDPSKGTQVTLRAGDQVVTSAARPQSENVIVVSVGSDPAFINALSAVGKLNVNVAGKNFDFAPAKMDTASDQLAKCVASINAPSPTVAAAAAPTAPEKQSAKTEMVSSPLKAEVSPNQPTQADNLAAENARLKQALQEARTRYQAPAAANVAATNELQEKLRANEVELAKLKEQLAAKTQAPAAPAAPPVDTKTVEQITNLQSENAKLKSQIDALSKERDALKTQSTSASAAASQATADTQKLASLEKQNQSLTAEISKLQSELEKKVQPASIISPEIAQEQTQKIAMLESENAQLKEKVNNAQAPAAPQDDGAVAQLRAQLAAAQDQKNLLQTQLETLQTQQEQSQIKSTGNNWDLEQATRRYQESQREIRRLGALIQQQKTACIGEKKEIESLLFDPAVADQAQVVKFTEMQDRIEMLEGQLRATGVEPAAGNISGVTQNNNALAQMSVTQDMPVPTGKMAGAVAPVTAQDLPPPSPAPIPAPMPKAQQALQPVAPKPSLAPLNPPATPAQAQAALKFQTQQDFTRLLKDAGVTTKDGVRPVQGANNPSYQAFRWRSNALQGSAEQRTLTTASEFQAGVEQYLDRARTRCKGEFAAVPSPTSSSGDSAQSSAYEIACVGGKSNSSASVLFSYGDGVMTTIAFEGNQDSMDQAIEARDRVAGQFGSLKTASR